MLVKEIKIKPLNYKNMSVRYDYYDAQGDLDYIEYSGNFSSVSGLHFFDSEGTQLLLTMDDYRLDQKVRTFTLSNGIKGSVECETKHNNISYMHTLSSVFVVNTTSMGTQYNGLVGGQNFIEEGDFLLVKFEVGLIL